MEPRISIIVSAFNSDLLISKTVESVLWQSSGQWELLVVLDVSSTDSTKDILQRYSSLDPRIRLIDSPQAKGISSNRNLGLKAASGEFVALADYRLVAQSRSHNRVQAAASRCSILRQREKLGLFSSVLHFIAYTLSSLRLRV